MSYFIINELNLLNLAAVTDQVFVLPVEGRDKTWTIFKVEREAD